MKNHHLRVSVPPATQVNGKKKKVKGENASTKNSGKEAATTSKIQYQLTKHTLGIPP